jgi:hypothetical protein
MKPFLQLSGKVAVVVFCLWHMMAVLVYALPGGSKAATLPAVQRIARAVSPYILMTSQWQQWNLFSPDPLRRVTSYVIERQQGDVWKTVLDLHTGTLPWWRHAAQFKMLGSLLDGNTESDLQHRTAERYLQLKCREYALPDASGVRLSYRVYVIPVFDVSMSMDWWLNYTPEESTYVGHETTCDPNFDAPPPA